MRVRPLLYTLMAASGTLVLLTGCSGKPENSPVIRQKFQTYDKMTASVDKLSADVAALTDQVRRLSEENAELRTQLPPAGAVPAAASAKPATTTTTGATTASAAAPKTTTTTAAPGTATTAKPVDLEKATLAGATTAAPVLPPLENAPAVLNQQEVPAPRTAAANFKKMTASRTESTPQQKAAASAEKKADKPAAQKAAAPKTANVTKSRGGSYYTIAAGETIEKIAAKNGVSVSSLLQANRIPKGARLAQGQRLFIPSK